MRRWLSLLLLACLATPAWGASEGAQALARAWQAERQYDYVGIQATRAAAREVEVVVEVAHVKGGITCRHFLAPPKLAGHGAIITPRGRLRLGAAGVAHWRTGLRAESADDLPLLLRNYQVVATGMETVAGREVQGYLIRPKRPGNPSKRIWLDRESGLMLKSALRNWEGKPVVESEFRQIKIGRNLPEAASQCRLPPEPAPAPHPRPRLDFTPVQPSYLPAGYQYQGQEVIMARGRPTAHLRYSDGLNTISLFEQQGAGPARDLPARRNMGFSSFLYRRLGQMDAAVIGDLPPEELQRLMDSLPAAS